MEHTKHIIAWELLFILVFASLIVVNSADKLGLSKITGLATQDIPLETVLSQVKEAVPKLNFIQDVNDASVCLIVNMNPSTKYSFEIIKIGSAIAVTNSSSELCKGESQEDFIVSYVSYDKLKEHLSNPPSLSDLRKVSDGTNFYIYPSKQILSGLKLADPSGFNTKFGDLLRKNFNSADVQRILNPPSSENPQSVSVVSYLFYFIIGMVVLVVVIMSFIFLGSKKPRVKEDLELMAYIKSSISQGYAQEDIMQTLISSGWDANKVQQAINSLNSQPSSPQTPA